MRRKIACHVISTLEEGENGNGSPKLNGDDPAAVVTVEAAADPEEPIPFPDRVFIDDVTAFKMSHPLWSLPKPFKELQHLVRKDQTLP